jgi:hypothetical protein
MKEFNVSFNNESETIELKEIIFSLSPRVKTFNIYIEEID